MLKNNKLLIDKNCPMCGIYGRCFTNWGLIEKGTVEHYQVIAVDQTRGIDMERAKTEIALKDNNTGQTIYGINAMIKMVAHDKKLVYQFLNTPLVYGFLKRLYNFISYNRKVIYPTAPQQELRTCQPALNLKYRGFYIFFVAIVTGFILNSFTINLTTSFALPHNNLREFFICFGQVFWQWAAITWIDKPKVAEYLGNMSTVSLIGGILLIPILLVNHYYPFNSILLIGLFGLVVFLMFLEHIRRCQILGLPFLMTLSWIAFRIVVLLIVGGLMLIA